MPLARLASRRARGQGPALQVYHNAFPRSPPFAVYPPWRACSACSALKAVPFAAAFPQSPPFAVYPPWRASSACSALKAVQFPCQRRGKKVINIKVCTWHGWKECEIGPQKPQKPIKNAKKPLKKSKSAIAHLNIRGCLGEKSPPGTGTARGRATAAGHGGRSPARGSPCQGAVAGRTLAPGPVGSQKSPENTPQNSRQKVIHIRWRA